MLVINKSIFRALSFMFILFELFVMNGYKRIGSDELNVLEYQINRESVLEVNGKTNVNSFCCTSNENYTRKKISYKYNSDGSVIVFDSAILSLQTDNLDCGRKAINKDMKKALQANKYPNIVLHLKEIQNSGCQDLSVCNEWVELTAVADITITCNTKRYVFPVVINKLGENYFRVAGETNLQLCDFDIEPPTALLGLVKVNDQLVIGFDLYIELG